MPEDQPKPIIVGLDPSITSFGASDGARHEVFKTVPVETLDEEHGIHVRTHALISALSDYLEPFSDKVVQLYIEGVQMRAPEHGGTHLFQMGFIMAGIMDLAQRRTYEGNITDTYFVGKTTYMKILFGKQHADTQIAKEAWKKYGVDIGNDRGLDKLDAWLIYRFGCGVRDGEWEFVPRNRRK